MADTTLLAMPLIAAAQGQKHVTHNDALKVLDGLVQLAAKSRTMTAPPGSPADGDRYIIPSGATGAWSGKTDQIAVYVDGAWDYHIPKTGWTCFVEGEGAIIYAGAWAPILALAAHGASTAHKVIEQEMTVAGATTDSSIVIPNRAIVLAVSERVTQAITGATSFSVGVVGDTAKFGGSLGITLGSNNIGVIGPTAYYADTAIRLTAGGSNFTGGKVRIAIHYLAFTASAS